MGRLVLIPYEQHDVACMYHKNLEKELMSYACNTRSQITKPMTHSAWSTHAHARLLLRSYSTITHCILRPSVYPVPRPPLYLLPASPS